APGRSHAGRVTAMVDQSRATYPVWTLPLSIAVLLVAAVHLAWWLSLRGGHVPACMPYLEGCTSISRAARHGPGNHVFRLMVLPCSALLALHWWSSARWLSLRGAQHGSGWLIALGVAAAVALAVYATFLGTEGAAYRFMRSAAATAADSPWMQGARTGSPVHGHHRMRSGAPGVVNAMRTGNSIGSSPASTSSSSSRLR